MADKPAAEVRIDTDLIRRLLSEQRPDLSHLPLRLAGEGWDNATWRLGPELAVRLPRRAAASELVRHEQDWLPRLAAHVDVGVPVPVHRGTPSGDYPWHWSVVPWFDGVPAGVVPLAGRDAAAPGLARFVEQIHRPAPADAPINPFRGGDLSSRSATVLDRLAVIDHERAAEALALWTDLSATPPWTGPPVWIHGDLHPFNILLETHETHPVQALGLGAVIDFGDVTAGDPATDLATAWLTFGPVGRDDFVRSVTHRCGTDVATWRRARAWAVAITTGLLMHSDDDALFASLGRTALDQALDDAAPGGC
ncbi:aminoglycoside phosphotransferase family protein [Sanguibacter antarcticus]|uniref:Aminoglycoside phosphotransferase (APT) family kinase protein n=1 Tax=Sanguibacter antarcticus TaxID=372484 RepID=A0A2A9E444_9MICO|nr:aminoglycoside phosphotransferase family protein [Sanguibacter antarcticus]PFG32959.1 aminoglycoside phosphotransferase (APT) family kinase protein [Sanguibacter antarcticus]